MNAPKRAIVGRVHCGIAIAILVVAAIGWNVLLYGYIGPCVGPSVAVPPPKLAVIRDHRLRSFPKSFGEFELAPETEGDRVPQDERDGVIELNEDVIETLGIPQNDWNWYYMATYRDKRIPPSQRGRYIRLDITYYTGPLEPVPHVPERAITASAGRIDPAGTGPLEMTLPGLPQPWAEALKKISVQRTVYVWTDQSTGGEERGALYHFFIVNGRPAHRWETVRSETTSRFRRRCYFAKVQVSLGAQGLHDVAAWDTFCQEFLRQAMPVVVKFLPSQTDLR